MANNTPDQASPDAPETDTPEEQESVVEEVTLDLEAQLALKEAYADFNIRIGQVQDRIDEVFEMVKGGSEEPVVTEKWTPIARELVSLNQQSLSLQQVGFGDSVREDLGKILKSCNTLIDYIEQLSEGKASETGRQKALKAYSDQ